MHMSEKNLAGRCGMYCGGCPVYRASHDMDDKRAQELASDKNCPVERIKCEGCGSDGLFVLSGDCAIRKCAGGRGLGSCGLCPEFPCEALNEFLKADTRIRGEARKNLQRIREVGIDKWLREADARWRCRHCDSKTAYDMRACRICKALINPPK